MPDMQEVYAKQKQALADFITTQRPDLKGHEENMFAEWSQSGCLPGHRIYFLPRTCIGHVPDAELSTKKVQ